MGAQGPGLPAVEALRRQLANKERPKRFQVSLRCAQGHPLLWLVGTEQGLVPVAKGAERRSFRLRCRDDGSPMTLDEWPAGELLPAASCPCHPILEASLFQARSWVKSDKRKVVFVP